MSKGKRTFADLEALIEGTHFKGPAEKYVEEEMRLEGVDRETAIHRVYWDISYMLRRSDIND